LGGKDSNNICNLYIFIEKIVFDYVAYSI